MQSDFPGLDLWDLLYVPGGGGGEVHKRPETAGKIVSGGTFSMNRVQSFKRLSAVPVSKTKLSAVDGEDKSDETGFSKLCGDGCFWCRGGATGQGEAGWPRPTLASSRVALCSTCFLNSCSARFAERKASAAQPLLPTVSVCCSIISIFNNQDDRYLLPCQHLHECLLVARK